MKESDQYHKWVEWSEEDQTYIGKCPDLITGIHGDDPIRHEESMWSPQAESPRIGMAHTVGAAHRLGLH